MRVLVGHIIEIPEVIERLPIPGRETLGDEILAFGNSYAHIDFVPGMSWPEILERCPDGWKPDAYIHVSPEYNAIPDGVEMADCLTAAVYGDWNLGGVAIRTVAGAFDVLIADKPGGAKLRDADYQVVRYAPIWAQNPTCHRLLRDGHDEFTGDRIIDVLMLGNMNHSIQWERAPWLARVARLSRKHNVMMSSGYFGEEYTRLMNSAKIVFNRSIRGELNMRAFEAPACGALMFYEDTNPEVRDIFTDRKDCVLYNAENLEDLIDFYLAPENCEERERIAVEGWKRVQTHSYTDHFKMLLDQIAPLVDQWKQNPHARSRRAFRDGSLRRRTMHLSHHWLHACNNPSFARINAALELEQRQARAGSGVCETPVTKLVGVCTDGAGTKGHEEAELANLRAVCLASWAAQSASAAERQSRINAALTQCQKALSFDRKYNMALVNLGYINLSLGRTREAQSMLAKAAEMLESTSFEPLQLRGAHFPRRFDFIDVELERVWIDHRPGSIQWGEGLRRAIGCRVNITLSELAFADARYLEACERAERATRYLPAKPEPLCTLGSARRALGQHSAAIEALTKALEVNPFLFAAREELARLHLDVGDPNAALDLLDDWAAITRGCPFYEPVEGPFIGLRAEAMRAASVPASNSPLMVNRLLAMPDWDDATSWQQIIRAFVATNRPDDPVQLMMRIEPEDHPDPRTILARLQEYLLVTLGVSASSTPNIALINQELTPDNRWKLLHAADAIVVDSSDAVPPRYRDLALTSGKPLIRAQDLAIPVRTRVTAA